MDALELKEKFDKELASRRFEIHSYSYNKALWVNDRMGTFSTQSWGAVAYDAKRFLADNLVSDPGVRAWLSEVEIVATELAAKYAKAHP